ncbi:MAG: zinc ribbon domain-containing protein [Mogibacterium sp.]|nr:zinc ribbon domain-containing protein [Mogibacterium sp.]
MLASNYLIINKKPQKFKEMRIAGRTAVFIAENGRPLDFGVLALDDSIYTMMSCEQVNLMMMVIDRQGSRTVECIFWQTAEGFEQDADAIKKASGLKISKQDLKINSYAWSIAKKLDEGVRVKVTDAVDASDMVVCPECGMLNPKGSPYCLDCGADIP